MTAVWTNLCIEAIVGKFNEMGIENHSAKSAAQVHFIIQQAESSLLSPPRQPAMLAL